MHFIFGYAREIPVKIEKETSTATLIIIGILTVLLFIFLSFEDIDEPARPSYLTFQASSVSTQMGVIGELEIDLRFQPEQNFRTSELKNSSPPKAGDLQSQ